MSPLTQDLRALGGASAPAARQATARWLAWLRHWQVAARMRRATARDGQRYGAVYVDGKLNCLLPGLERL
jgi:hypothetical protein